MSDLVAYVKGTVPVRYRGEPVLTLPQMDRHHELASGSSHQNFLRSRGDLLEGTYYFDVPYEEWSVLGFETDSESASNRGGYRGSMILLTERGYLYLACMLRGKKAAQVRHCLLEHYFRSRSLPDEHPDRIAQYAKLVTDSLLPVVKAQAEATTEAIAHMAHGQRDLQNKVDRIDNKLEVALGDIADMKAIVGKRKEIKTATRQLHVDTVMRFYRGLCPSCRERAVLDEFGNLITGAHQFDHRFSPDRPHWWETWLICDKCNSDHHDGRTHRKQEAEPQWIAYQDCLRKHKKTKDGVTLFDIGLLGEREP